MSTGQSVSNIYSGLSRCCHRWDHKECHRNTVGNQLQYNVWAGLLEQIMFQLVPKGRWRISQHDVVGQAFQSLATVWQLGRLEPH